MNLFSKIITVKKTDFFGNEYETQIIEEKKLDLGEAWSGFRKQFLTSIENSNSLNRMKANGKQEVSKEWYERESEKQLLNDQK